MNLLLDTHVFLWWDASQPTLNAKAQAIIQAQDNTIFVSAASVWEIAIDWDHNDPFDRLLIAQAMRLGCTLLTANRTIRTFGDVAQIWAG